MNSIFHFFGSLLEKKDLFQKITDLEKFPYEQSLLSCQNKGKFPDLAIKLNKGSLFTGGELIELKDSKSYQISSFNSTIPTGRKEILQIIGDGTSNIRAQMENAGDCVESLPIREVYYLIRGRKKDAQKIVLVHGSFFETVEVGNLISRAFSQVIEEGIENSNAEISQEEKDLLSSIFSNRENFSKVRTVEKASVKLRFRVMTEVKAEGNLLNKRQYPEILDNTINFIVPLHTEGDEEEIQEKAEEVFTDKQLSNMKIFKIKHHFNGYFRVFQQTL